MGGGRLVGWDRAGGRGKWGGAGSWRARRLGRGWRGRTVTMSEMRMYEAPTQSIHASRMKMARPTQSSTTIAKPKTCETTRLE